MRCQLAAIAALAALCQGAHAATYEVGEGALRVNGSVFVGTAVRTVGQDAQLLPDVNSSWWASREPR